MKDLVKLTALSQCLLRNILTGKDFGTTKLHLAQDILCEIYKLNGHEDPEGDVGNFCKLFDLK